MFCAALMSARSAVGVPSPFEAAVGDCMAEQSRSVAFSGVVVAGQGEARFLRASGFADAAGQMPITRDTPFRLASVGKVFTRVAVGLLADAGKLRLDDSVRRHLPELPPAFEPITLAQLLEHRSGVATMTRPNLSDAPALAGARTARDLVALVAAKPLSFEPGSRQEYSNGGYLLLGAVIESASGQSYRDYVSQHLFGVVGMRSSSFEPGKDAAVPMTRLGGPGQPPLASPRPRMEFPEFKASSAGDALSSAADLQALAMALTGDRLLSPTTKAAVFPRQSTPWRLGQSGGSVGTNTAFWVLPERAAWLIVLSNFDPPAGELMGQALSPIIAGDGCKVQEPGEALSGHRPS